MIKKTGLKDLFLWTMGQRQRFQVQGDSMEPLLKEGDQILTQQKESYSTGDLVVFRHPIQSNLILIKKIVKKANENYEVLGLNEKKSSDSRHFGPLSKNHILGHVTSML